MTLNKASFNRLMRHMWLIQLAGQSQRALSGFNAPAMILISVDLPAPF
jgi:hypothetical protein